MALYGDEKRGEERLREGVTVWEVDVVYRYVKNWVIHCLAVLNISLGKSFSADENRGHRHHQKPGKSLLAAWSARKVEQEGWNRPGWLKPLSVVTEGVTGIDAKKPER